IDFMIVRWSADYEHPHNFMYGLFHSKIRRFRKFISSRELDSQLEEARVQQDPPLREKEYQKIQTTPMSSGTLLPLFHDIDYRLAGAKVQNLKLTSRSPYINYMDVALSQQKDA